VGSYGLKHISVYQMDLELPGGFVAMNFYVPVLTINAVPKPTSYALMGLGLLGTAGVARRRRSA